MKSRPLVEASVLGAIGVGSIVEGFRVIHARDPSTLSDVLGPGAYIVGLGALLLLTTLGHALATLRSAARARVAAHDDGDGLPAVKVAASVAALCAYAFLIDAIGYVVPTFLLLLVQSRLFGLSPLWKCGAVAAGLTLVFYVVFVRFANIAFPHGALWG